MSPTSPVAYWDVTGDNLPDLNPLAIYVGGVSGTHRGAQLYFENDGTTPLPIPYEAILTLYAGGEYLAMFYATNGASLALAGNWLGPSSVSVAANSAGTVGHTNNYDFAKLTFSLSKGWTNNSARVITAKIQALKNGELSQNSGNVLNMGLNLSLGNVFGGEDFQIVGDEFWMPQFLSAASANQGLIVLRTSQLWSKNDFRTNIGTDSGLNGRIIDYSPAASGKALICSGLTTAPDTRKSLNLVEIDSFDSDGFPNWGSVMYINGEGTNASNTNIPYPHPTLTLNNMPVILAGRFPTLSATGDILVNQGTEAAPAYTGFLAMSSIDTKLRSAQHVRYDSQGRAYFAHAASGAPTPTGYGVARLTYTGANNNETALLTPGNWTYEEIGFIPIAGASPPANGNGQTASFIGRGIAIDETDTVNGEPTLYMSDRLGHVIFRIRRNLNSFGDGRDWDFTIIVGQSGVSGSTEGIGTAALLNQPCGLNIFNGDLYCVEKINAQVRKITLPGLQTSVFYGQTGVLSHVDQFTF